jgi:hypothetical protein
MVTSILQRLAVATAGTVLSLTVLQSPTLAAFITYDFTLTIFSDPFQGNQYEGFFRYDDAALTPAFTGTLFNQITEFEFNFLNSVGAPTTYATDDLIRNGLYFSNGLFSGLEVEKREGNNVSFDFNTEPVALEDFLFTLGPLPTNRFGRGSVRYNLREEPVTSVPEPEAALSLTVLGLGFLGGKVLSGLLTHNSKVGNCRRCGSSIS